jgi:uncharacterized membrane protein YphA (DoxX/SURF4 family)
MNTFYPILPFLAHTLIGCYFIFLGVWNIYHWFSTLECMSRRDIPHPYLWLSIVILWQSIAGILIVLGVFIKLAALTLIPLVFITLWMLYDFWNHSGDKRKGSQMMFATHITIILGALILLLA